MKEKINLDERYFPNEELYGEQKGIAHYTPMFKAIESTFNLDGKVINDIGCREGWLLSLIKDHYPNTFINGFDYFPWMQDNCAPNVKKQYYIWDMRDDLTENFEGGLADLMISTEVGEHIDPDYADIYIQNMKHLLARNGCLIMSWCEIGGDKHGQHVNPLNSFDFHKLMDKNGFEFDLEATKEFLQKCRENKVQQYYIDSNLSLWRKK